MQRLLAGKSTLSRLELPAAGFNGKKARRIVTDFDRMDDLPEDLLVDNDEKAPREIVLDFEPHGGQTAGIVPPARDDVRW